MTPSFLEKVLRGKTGDWGLKWEAGSGKQEVWKWEVWKWEVVRLPVEGPAEG